jgi:two-component system, OmpR family, phosphate regulon response regulator PhoB
MVPKPKHVSEMLEMPEHISEQDRESSEHWQVIQGISKGARLKKILIIEDQADIRKLVKMTLDFSDYELHEASEADSGFGMVKAIQPDLILLDIMMPGEIDGLSLCAMLKATDKFKHIPIILLTARGQAADRQAGLEAGADEYLVKPFSPIKLIEVVESFLHKAQREFR